jgi:hypothetical protein
MLAAERRPLEAAYTTFSNKGRKVQEHQGLQKIPTTLCASEIAPPGAMQRIAT